jgi:crotonobetainyl-CoA hydratase
VGIRTQAVGQVLVVTIDRPPANAVDVPTSLELYRAFAGLRDDARLRAGIVTGSGDRFFCAGWDLKAAAAGESIDADHGPGGFAGLTEFFDLGKPVIAAVNGLALGGGFELMLAADLAVAASHAEFALTEATLGLVADAGGVLRLPARLPRAVALDCLLTGRPLPAAQAERWGLVNQVVPAAELARAALALAGRVCASAPLAVTAVLEIVRQTERLDIGAGFHRLRSGELPAYQAVLASADAQEGPRAFAERRPPSWTGQ